MAIDLYRATAWPLLVRLDPETAHTVVLRVLEIAERIPRVMPLLDRLFAVRDPRLAVDVFGLRYPNPVGLAAGLDKNAHAPRAFAALGFGAVEVGTITPAAQPGNPRPRIFRLPRERALINRMGFPNRGATAARAWLLHRRGRLPGGAILGVNLGKGKETPIEAAVRDYVAVLDALYDVADYAVVNVSSPNTQGLRDLQERASLDALLAGVVRRRDTLDAGSGRCVPLLVKVAPDLDWPQLGAIAEAAGSTRIDGIVATNTTLSREGVNDPRRAESGGLSGEPLRRRALEVVRWLVREMAGRVAVVGAGGISHPDHALEMLDAGARLIQLYTGLIYTGPTLPARICRALLERR
jgi:dihydroorotate dehydrogenase